MLTRDLRTPALITAVVAGSNDAAELLDSERRYFSAGSRNTTILGGTFSVATGFERLPAGCVMHGIEGDSLPTGIANWTRQLEELFRDHGSLLCRFYLPSSMDHLHNALVRLGYRPCKEIGLAMDLEQGSPKSMPNPCLAIIADEVDWARKVDLYIEAGIGPDGHEMQQGAYADFEFAKYAAGYMVCYLYWRDRRPVASVSLAVHKGFARLKNVVLHPDARGQGLGHKIVRALIAEAVGARATRFGAFAAEGGPAHNVYRNCGLRDATYQKEWTKPL